MSAEVKTKLTIEYIPSATVEPVIVVKEGDTIEHATTLMRLHNFSQLPIMRGTGKRPIGVVSWRSVAKALLVDQRATLKACVDKSVAQVQLDDPLLELIPRITQDDYVLVVKENKEISGIVTSADLGDALLALTRPYLLVSECEDALRNLVSRCLELSILGEEDVRGSILSSSKAFSGQPEELAFGDLVKVLKKEQIWAATSARIDQQALGDALNEVAWLRNRVMHFRELETRAESVRDQLPHIIAEVKALNASLTVS